MASVEIRDARKSFGSVEVLHGIDVEVPDKSFTVLVGPSGCGKSTLLKLIAGLEDPDAGEIRIGGRPVNHLPPARRNVAMVFQAYALYPHMSVFDNMAFPLKMARQGREAIAERVREVAEVLHLEALLARKPAELSGGQRQRVALARAIVREPNVFLMDEPLSNLDAKLRVSTRAQIKNLSHELAVTTIYVTHDQIEAMTLAARVVVMNRGVVQQVGTPTEIYDKPANSFVASFIGNPAMNLMEGKIEGGTFSAQNTVISGLDAPDGPVTRGFRAEDAEVGHPEGQINAPIYTLELLGEATMVSVRIGGVLISGKADKSFRAEIDDTISIRVPPEHCHLFGTSDGNRIEA